MKNEQKSDQSGNKAAMKQPASPTQNAGNQQQDTGRSNSQNSDQRGNTQNQSSGKSQQEKSNISVDNEGRIGKAHDWNGDTNNPEINKRDNNRSDSNQDGKIKSDKSVSEPGIDTPMYEPGKSDKQTP